MSLSSKLYRRLKTELFPNAVHISGYGNTLFGVCLEVESNEQGNLNYFSPGPRLILRIVPRCDGSTEEEEKQQRLEQTVNYGERGQVVFHRLDESFLIINMFERDEARRIPSSPKAQELGLFLDGLGDPLPMITSINKKSSLGIY
jgi:hypothetical protein